MADGDAERHAKDRDAVARVIAGDLRAFGAIFERYAPMVHGLLLARVTPAEADDLVQDVFETALGSLASLREVDALGAWLAQIARRRAVDAKRRERKTESLDDDVPSPPDDPGARADAHRILATIQALPEAYRETLVLRLVEGMTGPEIAARVGLTPESVRVNLHRGMKMLKERLDP